MKISDWNDALNTGYYDCHSVIRINQKALFNERCIKNIDFKDAALFSFCAEFILLRKRAEAHPDFPKYKWISFELIKKALPLLKLKEDAIGKRLNKIIKVGLLRTKSKNIQDSIMGTFSTKNYYMVTKKGQRVFLNIKTDSIPDIPWFNKKLFENLEDINITEKIHKRPHSVLLDAYRCKDTGRTCPYRFNKNGWACEIEKSASDSVCYCYLPQKRYESEHINPPCIAWNYEKDE